MILVAQVAYIVLRAERYNSISSPFLFEETWSSSIKCCTLCSIIARKPIILMSIVVFS
ncbi:hypothetical protein Plhal304r1_c024g0082511 [Plasmopara halstedii]